ncbi:IS4 family transposase [Anaerocolumna jejuensis]|uniref:IS4 family transposase n=1 Tax=Anaerocolumna jejuensis TaxID=259063 RepID=UPI003F7CBC4B
MGGNTISKELWNYFGYSTTTVSASAFVQQRSKIKYQAIEEIFHSFVNKCDRQSLYKGYRLLAVDGSDVRLPTDKREIFTYLANDDTSEGYNLLHLDAMYDILQHIYVDVSLQPKIGMNEHSALVSMIDRSKIQDKAIIIADRGYASFNNIVHCQEKNWSYIIRSKETYGIKYTAPHTETYNIDVMITLTRRQTKETRKLIKENPERYRWIQPHTTFDYIQPKSDTMYDLPIRIVRFKLSDTSFETIFTNLPRKEFSADVLKELYHLRWGIETSFKELKYNVGLINFHSKKIEFLLQEIYAKLIMYNFSASIVYDQPTVQNKPIRSNRTFERKKKPKSAISFTYRIS